MLIRPGTLLARRRGAAPVPPPAVPFSTVNEGGWHVTYPSVPAGPTLDEPFTVIRAGFDATGAATTYADTVLVTRRLNQVYPNGSLYEPDLVALSDEIFFGDVIAGATNNATEPAPKPIGKWDVIGERVIGNSLFVASHWAHMSARAKQEIRAARYRLSIGGVAKGSAIVSLPTMSANAGWAWQIEQYAHTFDFSNTAEFPDGSILRVDVDGIPWFGTAASIRNTADETLYYRMPSLYFLINRAKAATPPIAVINRDGAKTVGGKSYGVGSSGGVVSTDPDVARATPFETWAQATTALIAATSLTGGKLDGCEVWVASDLPNTAGGYSDTPLNSGADRATDGFAVTLRRDPNIPTVNIGSLAGDPRLSGTVAHGGGAHRLIIQDITSFGVTGSVKFRNRSTSGSPPVDYVLVNCGGSLTGYGGDFRGGDSCRQVILWGGTYTNVGSCFQASSLGNLRLRGVTATTIDKSANRPLALEDIAGCELSGFTTGSLKEGRQYATEAMAYFGRCMNNYRSNTGLLVVGEGAGAGVNDGVCFVNLVVEHNGASERNMRLSGDANTAVILGAVVHGISSPNPPGVNGGWNNGYDDVSPTRGGPHKRMSMKNNVLGPMPSKGDGFANDGLCVANRAYSEGVNHSGNYSSDTTGFQKRYFGLNSSQGATGDTGIGSTRDPLWSNQQVWISGAAGPGGGSYYLQPGSPVRAISVDPVTRFALGGTEHGATTCPGAHGMAVAP